MISLRSPRLRTFASSALLASALSPLWTTGAAAQDVGFALDQFRSAETPTDGFSVSRPTVLPHLRGAAQLTLDYALNPLVREVEGMEDSELVGDQVVATVAVSLGLFDRAQAFVLVPISLLLDGDGVTSIEDQGFSDPTLGARLALVGDDQAKFALAAQLGISLPLAELSADTQRFTGERTVGFMPEVIGELRLGERFRGAANLGARVRGGSELEGLDVGSELTWNIGIELLASQQFSVHFETYGATGFSAFFEREETPVEVIGGLRIRPVDGFVVGLAGGTGITPGYGASQFRGVLSIGYAPPAEDLPEPPPPPLPADDDRDRDRVANDDDGCPDDPEDADDFQDEDGCAEDDNDNDGVPDESDAAPNEPEDVDQFEDEDGAPDPDNDQDNIEDGSDRCPIEAEDRDNIQDEDGCPETDADGDTINDPDDHCPITPGIINQRNPECTGCPALACMSEPGVIRILQRIEFENNSDALRAQSTPVLEAVKTVLETNPQIRRLRVEGHTDDRGNDTANMDLSRRRAASVVTWLTTNGIAADRLESEGFGETRPLQPNTNNANRQANRRVEFHIVDPAPPAATEPADQAPPANNAGQQAPQANPDDPAVPANP